MIHKSRNRILAAVAVLALTAIQQPHASAQRGNIFDYATGKVPGVETFEMIKYGGHEHSLYTGAMTYSIPLYEYKDPDFDLPLVLDYAFDGFKPNLNSGTVGYGWRLSCGGAITREVNGLPDETDWDDRRDVGYLCTIRDGAFDYNIMNSSMFWPYMGASFFQLLFPAEYLNRQVGNMNLFSDMPSFYDHVQSQPYTRRHYDPSPDLFHFSFNGIQGDFMLARDGTFEVFNSNVPHGEIGIEWVVGNGLEIRFSRFIISTGDGYRYHFGMDRGDASKVKSTLEYSFGGTVWDSKADSEFMMGDDDEAWQEYMASVAQVNPHSILLRQQLAEQEATGEDWFYSYAPHGTVSAWKLVMIEAPNGRTMKLNYGRTYVDFIREVRYHPSMRYVSQSGGTTSGGDPYQSLTSTFTCPLESIEVDDREVIVLTYEDRDVDESNVNCFREYPQQNPTGSNWDSFPLTEMGRVIGNPNDNSLVQQCLSGVSVYNDQSVEVENISLSHFFTNPEGGSPKMFLSSVCSRNRGRFNLGYNVDQWFIFPHRDTRSVDHWGYWNGESNLERSDIRQLIDRSHLNSGGLYEQLVSSMKDANFDYSSRGALVSVVFPTGGHLNVGYEPHSAGQLVERDGTHYPHLVRNSYGMIPGGVRVRSLSENDGTTTLATVYEYRDSDSLLSGESSGTLLFMPRYACDVRCSIGQMGSYRCIAFSRECDLTYLKDSHVGYSTVCRMNPDGSVDEYHFIDYASFPDDFSSHEVITKQYLSEEYDISSPDESSFIFKYAAPSKENSIMRGRLSKEVHWVSPGGLKMSEKEYEYSYNSIALDTIQMYTNAAVCFLRSEFVIRTPELVLQTERIYDASTGAELELQTRRIFNSLGQEKSVAVSNTASGMMHVTETTYGHEVPGRGQDFAGLPGLVYNQEERQRTGLGSRLVRSRTFHYDLSSGNPLPERIEEDRDGGVRTVRITYDGNFRPSQVSLPGGGWLRYGWSDDGRHIVSMSRNDGSMTTGYTWMDMVGLSSVQLPSGLSESYDYDDRCRLSGRRNSDGALTASYEYQLNNE